MGSWSNLIEMEDNLTLEELYLLLEAKERLEYRREKFLAAMQGVDLDANSEDNAFERVRRQAAAQQAGISEEEYVFTHVIGIEIDTDDEE